MRLLVIEDEPDLRRTLVQAMREAGYAVDEAGDGPDGFFMASECDYDAIILDIQLPGLDGFSLLQKLRQRKATPVLVLTARARVNDRIHGLNIGADDYLQKPVDLGELAARVAALIRRARGIASPKIVIGDVEIDLASRRVSKCGAPISTTAREFALIEHLAMRRGKIVTRTEIYEHLCDEHDSPLSNVVDVHVASLRRKLGADFVITYRGQGYAIER